MDMLIDAVSKEQRVIDRRRQHSGSSSPEFDCSGVIAVDAQEALPELLSMLNNAPVQPGIGMQ